MRTIISGEAEIPVLGIGTWQLRGDEATRIVARALAEGYSHIDTARMYGNEMAVGKGIAEADVPRERVFLTTKVWPDDFRGGDFAAAVDDSLRQLDTDYVDLLLLHWPSPTVPLEETMAALTLAAEQGKARHVGVSNFTISLFREAERLAGVPIVCNQVEFHPFIAQERLRLYLESEGRALTAYCPLAKGQVFREPVLRRIGETHGASPAQIALAWELSHPNVAVIPKTATPARLAENLAALNIPLSDEEKMEIAALGSPRGRMVELSGLSPDWDE